VIWLLTRLVVWPFKIGTGSAKVGYRTGRMFGYRRILVFGLGVACGLLLAPMTGAAMRAKIRELLDGSDLPNDPVPAEAPSGRDVVDLTQPSAAESS
jgi:hypothetical protein